MNVKVKTSRGVDGRVGVLVDVDAVVLAGEDDRAVIHEADVETLGVFDFGLECVEQFALLGEDGQVEVVVIVGDEYFVVGVDAHANGVVGDAFAADLTQKVAVVVEDLDAVSAIVADVDLLALVRVGIVGVGAAHAVGELEIFGAVEFV